jgi:hypothetical protein
MGPRVKPEDDILFIDRGLSFTARIRETLILSLSKDEDMRALAIEYYDRGRQRSIHMVVGIWCPVGSMPVSHFGTM